MPEKYPHKVLILALVSILSITFLSFWPSLQNDFTHWDDPGNLTQNILVRQWSLRNICEIFTTPVLTVYVPLTILSFTVEYHFFQFNPFVYHLDNLLLHLAVTGLVFIFILRLGLSLPAAVMSTLIFAIHPTRVESVAWITERKDVLYAFFYMLALNHYWSYLSHRKKRFYAWSLWWGLLSILSKPMALSLPLVLLLCDWFYQRKIDERIAVLDRKLFLEKLPFLLYLLPIAFITFSNNIQIPKYNLFQGILIWCWGLSFYIQKFLWPVNLLPIYDFPKQVDFFNPVYNFSILMVLVFFLFIFCWRRNRWVIFGALFFLSSIFLLLRSHDIPGANLVADRFMYLPALGFCMIFGYFAQVGRQAWQKYRGASYLIHICLVIIFCSLSFGTFQQTRIWKDDLSLWNYVIRLSPRDPIALTNRGVTLHAKKDNDLALKDFNRALEIDPEHASAYNNRGVIYFEQGAFDLAQEDFNQALACKPDYAQAYHNRGRLYFKKGDTEKALSEIDQALAIDPLLMPAYMDRAEICIVLGKYAEALADYRRVLKFDPLNVKAYTMQAHIYNLQKQYDSAIAVYTQFIKVFPKDARAFNQRGIAYTIKGDFARAKSDFDQVLKLDPRNAEGYNNRANIYFRISKFDLALKDFEKATQFNPRYLEAFNNLGNMYLIKRKYTDAIENYNQAINLNPRIAGFYYQRSWAYASLGDFKSAVADARTAQSLGLRGMDEYIQRLNQAMSSPRPALPAQKGENQGVPWQN